MIFLSIKDDLQPHLQYSYFIEDSVFLVVGIVAVVSSKVTVQQLFPIAEVIILHFHTEEMRMEHTCKYFDPLIRNVLKVYRVSVLCLSVRFDLYMVIHQGYVLPGAIMSYDSLKYLGYKMF